MNKAPEVQRLREEIAEQLMPYTKAKHGQYARTVDDWIEKSEADALALADAILRIIGKIPADDQGKPVAASVTPTDLGAIYQDGWDDALVAADGAGFMRFVEVE